MGYHLISKKSLVHTAIHTNKCLDSKDLSSDRELSSTNHTKPYCALYGVNAASYAGNTRLRRRPNVLESTVLI